MEASIAQCFAKAETKVCGQRTLLTDSSDLRVCPHPTRRVLPKLGIEVATAGAVPTPRLALLIAPTGRRVT